MLYSRWICWWFVSRLFQLSVFCSYNSYVACTRFKRVNLSWGFLLPLAVWTFLLFRSSFRAFSKIVNICIVRFTAALVSHLIINLNSKTIMTEPGVDFQQKYLEDVPQDYESLLERLQDVVIELQEKQLEFEELQGESLTVFLFFKQVRKSTRRLWSRRNRIWRNKLSSSRKLWKM